MEGEARKEGIKKEGKGGRNRERRKERRKEMRRGKEETERERRKKG